MSRSHRRTSILYELHVQDYTRLLEACPTGGARHATWASTRSGLTTPAGRKAGLDHLVELGVNAVELMPVMEYDEQTGNAPGRLNHWGYMTTNFFAPEARYASAPGAQVTELKQLIQALHERGIAVFMDVVYNHTGEQGPWLDGGRLAAKCYNLMCQALPQVYRPTADGLDFTNATGTGNDLDFSGGAPLHQAAGHRFAGALAPGLRRRRLSLRSRPHPGRRVRRRRRLGRQRPALRRGPSARRALGPGRAVVRLHGQLRLECRQQSLGQVDRRLSRSRCGCSRSRQLRSPVDFKRLIEGYGATGRGGGPASSRPWRSVNFVSVHDGYTLRDCTFFNDPDGSQNCWDSGGDENLRREREKLLIGLLLTSQGVPILLQGDEFGATKSGAADQEGARNSYNYEAEPSDPAVDQVNLVDWRLLDGDNGRSPKGPDLRPRAVRTGPGP